jgi:predicted nucleic acid-binding protein
MICLDSSFLIDLLRNNKLAIEKVKELEDEEFAISSISFFEIMLGINLMKHNKEERRKQFNKLIDNLETLDMDIPSADLSSKISADLISEGKTIDQFDCLIAGSILSNNINEILTKDKEHFSRIENIKVISY